MIIVALDIQFESPNKWSGWADLGSEQSPEPYAVFAESLEELRDLANEFAAGAIYSSEFRFEEFLSISALQASKNS